MSKSLRSYLDLLRKMYPEEYVEIDKEVDPNIEITAITGRLEKVKRYPCLMFNKVKGSEFRVVTNVFTGRRKQALAFEMNEENILEEYTLRRNDSLVKPKLVSTGPCKEVILKGDKIDLSKLPICTTSEKDAGPYITVGACVTLDPDEPEFPNRNLGIYRHMYRSKDSMFLYYSWAKHIHYLHHKYEEMKKPMPIAVAIGIHPAIAIATEDQMHGHEYEVAGALMKEPVELVRCETVPLEVPADSEFVIEGEMLPGERGTEAPFGEYTRYYGQITRAPIVRIKCITHRKDAIYENVSSGQHYEHLTFTSFEASILHEVRKQYPSVKSIHLPYSGVFYWAFVAMDKLKDGDPKQVGMMILALQPILKYVVIVDPEVDIQDEREVLWAISTRCRADEDWVIIPGTTGNRLDPTTYNRHRDERDSMVTKVIMDATTPKEIKYERPEIIMEPMVDKINLRDYGLSELGIPLKSLEVSSLH